MHAYTEEEALLTNMDFDLKSVTFLGRPTTIICQNQNGPCPLLALANALALCNRLRIHPDRRMVSLDELVGLITDVILESSTSSNQTGMKDTGPAQQDEQQEQRLDDVFTLMPKLANGLDLNVRFTDVTGFEFTKELALFDVLDITVCHGWILDPQDTMACEAIKNMTYNHVMNRLVEYKSLQEKVAPSSRQGAVDDRKISAGGAQGSYTDSVDKAGLSIDISEVGLLAMNKEDDMPFSPTRYGGVGDSIAPPKSLGSLGKNVSDHIDIDKQEIRDAEDAACDVSNGLGHSPALSGGGSIYPGPSMQLKTSSPVPVKIECDVSKLTEREQTLLTHGYAIEVFLKDSASQLTCLGLEQLHSRLKERQIGVFFRNNHFSTIFKYNGELYLLVTDEGYSVVGTVVWERLNAIDGNTEYVDGSFNSRQQKSLSRKGSELVRINSSLHRKLSGMPVDPISGAAVGIEPVMVVPDEGTIGVDPDLALAMALQEEERQSADSFKLNMQEAEIPCMETSENPPSGDDSGDGDGPPPLMAPAMLGTVQQAYDKPLTEEEADREMARRLQAEEDHLTRTMTGMSRNMSRKMSRNMSGYGDVDLDDDMRAARRIAMEEEQREAFEALEQQQKKAKTPLSFRKGSFMTKDDNMAKDKDAPLEKNISTPPKVNEDRSGVTSSCRCTIS